jgi:DNA modification methylase
VHVLHQAHGETWAFYHGDVIDVLPSLPEGGIDLIVTSPPFAQLYTYSASERDLGNSRTEAEFLEHFAFVVRELLRVLAPGRVAAVHVFDIPAMLVRDGYIGLKDFSGDVIRLFLRHGWTFDARIPIDKNQQAQSLRTHAKGLTFQQLERDRSWSRPALPDYILKFRKPGDNARPVEGGVSRDQWIEWANPTWPNEHDRCAEFGAHATWYGIRETDTLNALRKRGYAGLDESREAADERHICPLQLGTIERCVLLWSNPDETVLDPFGGIASTGYVARKLGRRFVGAELKPSYFAAGARNLRVADAEHAGMLPGF